MFAILVPDKKKWPQISVLHYRSTSLLLLHYVFNLFLSVFYHSVFHFSSKTTRVFHFSDENKYDLVNYWNTTGLTGEEITALYQKTIDDQLALLYLKEQEKGGETINAVKKVTRKIQLRISHTFNHIFSISVQIAVPFSFCGKGSL